MGIYQVRSETVTVCGQRFVVRQATTDDANQRALLISKMSDKWKSLLASSEITDGDPDMAMYANRYFETLVYPSLIHCTISLDAPLPTLEECHEMPNDEMEKWIGAVKRNNPNYFPSDEIQNAEDQDADDQKKS